MMVACLSYFYVFIDCNNGEMETTPEIADTSMMSMKNDNLEDFFHK